MDINAALEQGIIKRTNRAVLVGMHPGITGNLNPEAEVLRGETIMEYQKYIAAKMNTIQPCGFDPESINEKDLKPLQVALTRWALRKGRAAIFADTGLGKTRMQCEWAKQVSLKAGRVLIHAPLAVAEQTVREAEKIGVKLAYSRKDTGEQIIITNYEMAEYFDPSLFAGVVLDESSILKSYDGATRTMLVERYGNTAFRLACTATPSPNDYTELGNHSEFLGIKTRAEMLAEYFVHDMDKVQDWRLKGHAEIRFWQWVASWGAMVRKPSDLGFDDTGYILPALKMMERVVEIDHTDAWKEGYLFAPEVVTLNDQRATRRATMEKRVALAKDLANTDAPCLIWCELNDEGEMLEKAIPEAIQVKGADDHETKVKNLMAFSDKTARVLITKASIAGFGMNWQHCNRMVFMGASHSFEMVYQAIRRCWRFGQKKPVEVFIIRAGTETAIMANFLRKEADAARMAEKMVENVRDILRTEISGNCKEWNDYNPAKTMTVPSWAGEEK